jgi:hypothetical protein
MKIQTLPKELADDRLDELLSLWARSFDNRGALRELTYPDTACGCVGGGYSQSWDDLWSAKELREIEVVDAAVESLPPTQRCAVEHKHLYAVFRFREPVDLIYGRARQTLRVVLPIKGVY